MARSTSPIYWPTTRIQRQGKVGHVNIIRKKTLKKVFVFAFLVLILGLFSVWSRIAIIETGYRIHQETNSNRQLRTESDSLKLEVATLRSPQRLEKMSKEKLQLHKPLEKQVIFVK
ncbi:MAG: hypothetical protein A3F89_05140 [Deltaproteobacteria bacterium RIFCSPLOWO2_12_FULL_50_11]|nr:MAG: hypothetical protein A3B79_02195 [Deltaproteobacteria bacterium RIFCSPHIGHO2_02_FULL_50_15]OGQ66782.1 MAG: hypothetical protein A3F89_05140 [Deltaproteobacteria bacterium RIFCSPLOWO2_12_FULL_50_11]